MVRPKLEYASSAWDPHQQNKIQKLERIQSKAARFVLNVMTQWPVYPGCDRSWAGQDFYLITLQLE